MADNPLAPNPKVRRTGAVILLLVVLCYVGAATGLDAHGAAGRIVLLVVGTLLLPVGLTLIRTRTPAIASIDADHAGLTFDLGHGRRESIPWTDVDAVWLRRLSPIFGGYLMGFRYVEGARRPAGLGTFERPADGGRVRVLIGLNAQQSASMRTELPRAAGSRFLENAPS